MRVVKDSVVTIEYSAVLDDGSVVDSTGHCGPITYLHGNEQIFPALERVIEGLEPGTEREVRLAPSESYGERREELVRRMPRTQLPGDMALEEGERYTLKSPDGTRLEFKVVSAGADEVVADFNSRAAGLGLNIKARVLAVRPATAEELRRGSLR